MTLKKYIPAVLVLGTMIILAAFSVASLQTPTYAAQFNSQSNTVPTLASSTPYALTWGALGVQIIATSTASTTEPSVGGRVALQLQPINCAAGGAVWLNFSDRQAATNTVMYVAASSTVIFGDTLPMVHGSVRAMSSVANCTLLVTEFRSENF